MMGNRAHRGEREIEREDLGGRETAVVERENGVGHHLRRWRGLIWLLVLINTWVFLEMSNNKTISVHQD